MIRHESLEIKPAKHPWQQRARPFSYPEISSLKNVHAELLKASNQLFLLNLFRLLKSNKSTVYFMLFPVIKTNNANLGRNLGNMAEVQIQITRSKGDVK